MGFEHNIALKSKHTVKMQTGFLFVSCSDSFCLITSHMMITQQQAVAHKKIRNTWVLGHLGNTISNACLISPCISPPLIYSLTYWLTDWLTSNHFSFGKHPNVIKISHKICIRQESKCHLWNKIWKLLQYLELNVIFYFFICFLGNQWTAC